MKLGFSFEDRAGRLVSTRAGKVAAVVLLLLATAAPSFSGDVIERIIAKVNGRLILQSDLDGEVRCSALLAGRKLAEAEATPVEVQRSLDRLIEHEFLRGEGAVVKPTNPDAPAVQQKIAELKAEDARHRVPASASAGFSASAGADSGVATPAVPLADFPAVAKDEAEWQARLASYGVSEAELAQYLAADFDLERVVEARLRPGLQVGEDEVERYYTGELLPKLREKNIAPAPLAQVAPKIREILTERALNRTLDAWLLDLRHEGDLWVDPAFAAVAAPVTSPAASPAAAPRVAPVAAPLSGTSDSPTGQGGSR